MKYLIVGSGMMLVMFFVVMLACMFLTIPAALIYAAFTV